LNIDVEGGSGSVLKIIDPVSSEPFMLREDQMQLARDAANRGVMARALRLAGFEITAQSVASPFGPSPEDKPFRTSKAEVARKKLTEERDRRSREEIRGIVSRGIRLAGDFRGREISIALPREVLVDGQPVRRVVIRQAVNRLALEELEQKPSVDALANQENTVGWVGLMGASVVKSGDRVAEMRIGNVLRMEMELAS
jgi:hypothetical protein